MNTSAKLFPGMLALAIAVCSALPTLAQSVTPINPGTGLPPGADTNAAPPATSDPDALSQARGFLAAGVYNVALQTLLDLYAQIHASTNGTPAIALILPVWIELGGKYPPAHQALADIQYRDTGAFAQGRGTPALFQELCDLNEALGQVDATYALFQDLERRQPALAKDCYPVLEPALLRHGDYQICLDHLGNPEPRFEIACEIFRREKALFEDQNARQQESLRMREAFLHQLGGPPLPFQPTFYPGKMGLRSSTNFFVNKVRGMILILVGTGHQEMAEYLRTNALALADDPRLQSTVSDAEEKLQHPGIVLASDTPPAVIAPSVPYVPPPTPSFTPLAIAPPSSPLLSIARQPVPTLPPPPALVSTPPPVLYFPHLPLPPPGVPPMDPHTGLPKFHPTGFNPATGLPGLAPASSVPPDLSAGLDPGTGLPATSPTGQPVPSDRAAWEADYIAFNNQILEISDLTLHCQYADALQRCLACQSQPNLERYSERLYGEWAKLNHRYPAAVAALRAIRDQKVQSFSTPSGGSLLQFAEVASINLALSDEAATVALFKQTCTQNPALGNYCYSVAESALLGQGEYQRCLNFIGDPQARFASARAGLASQKDFQKYAPVYAANYQPPKVPDMPAAATNNFVSGVCQLVEILIATGHQPQAETIRDQAVAVVGPDSRLASALDTAAETIKQHPPIPATATGLENNAGDGGGLVFASSMKTFEALSPVVQMRAFTAQGDYNQALQIVLGLYATNDIVYLNLVLPDWLTLGGLYPPARTALLALRDYCTRELAAGRGSVVLFEQVQTLDGHLDDDAAAHALYKTMEQVNPPLAQTCFPYVEPLLKQRGDYQTCLKHMGDPEKNLVNYHANLMKMRQVLPMWRENAVKSRELAEKDWAVAARVMAQQADQMAQAGLANLQMQQAHRQQTWDQMRTNPVYADAEPMPATPPDNWQPVFTNFPARFAPRPLSLTGIDSGRNVTNNFVGHICDMVEILVATGNQAEAQKIRDQAVADLDDPRLRSAITDAQTKLAK